MGKLTPKQQQIYDFISSFADEHGSPPSVREIAAAVGLKSPATVHFHLKGLREAGYISQAEGKTRAITIVGGEAAGRKDQVPLVGYVAAGAPILAQEHIEEYLTFDTGGLSGEHFALTVRGESMLEAGILPGDVVVVHQQPQARNTAREALEDCKQTILAESRRGNIHSAEDLNGLQQALKQKKAYGG